MTTPDHRHALEPPRSSTGNGTRPDARHVVVGIDGTGVDGESGVERRGGSNVSRLLAACARSPVTIVHYHPGVGGRRDWWRAGLAARGLNRQVRRAWQRLCVDWRPGMDVTIVGWSRGGAAAISLANLVRCVGLTPAGLDSRVAHEAMDVYGGRQGTRSLDRIDFRRRHRSRTVPVVFVGAWDPVGALGAIWPTRLARLRFGHHDLTLPPRSDLRHVNVLAADETRRAFRPIVQLECPGSLQVWMRGGHGDIGTGDAALEIVAAELRQVGVPCGAPADDMPPGDALPVTDDRTPITRLLPTEPRDPSIVGEISGGMTYSTWLARWRYLRHIDRDRAR